MPNEEIKLPQLGETVTEGTLVKWLKSVGESVDLDEPLYEISTEKVDTEVPSLHKGVLTEIKVAEGSTVDVGVVLGVMEVAEVAENAEEEQEESKDAEDEDLKGSSKEDSSTERKAETKAERKTPIEAQKNQPRKTPKNQPTKTPKNQPTQKSINKKITSPLVRRLIRDSGIDESIIIPSGLGGRITRKDVERAVAANKAAGRSFAGLDRSLNSSLDKSPDRPALKPVFRDTPATETRIPLSKIRKITAKYMRNSKEISPHVLTAVEVDFERLEKVRQKHRPEFKTNEGFSLTYLPFIIRAVCDALKEYPHINASIVDEELVVPNYVNVGVAVDLNFEGLLAPVIRDADTKSLTELAREIVALAGSARSKALKPDDLAGGTFTITNPGQYGTLMQFPIINQPQSAILSTDGVKRKPVALTTESGDEYITIHSVGVLALAWDHRAFDGALVAAFLNHLRSIIETRDWETEF